jgi:hypothetical protein
MDTRAVFYFHPRETRYDSCGSYDVGIGSSFGLGADGLSDRLSSGLRTAYYAFCLPRQLCHHRFALVFGQILNQHVVSTLQIGIATDVFQHSFSYALLPVQFTHFVQYSSAFQAVARHRLDVGPILGIIFDIPINFCIHFRIGSESGLICGVAAGARWRGGFRFVHNDSWFVCCAAFAVFAGEGHQSPL